MANTRFKAEDGILVVGASGVNSEFYTDLNVYGNLVVNAALIVIGNSTFANGLFGTNTLFIDTVHGRVGINNTSPAVGIALEVNGNTNIEGNLTVQGSVFFVNGNITTVGNLIFANVQTSGLLANADGNPLGNSTFRFDGFFYDVIVYHTLMPSSNTILLGNTTARWVLYANTGNFTGNVTVGTGPALFVNPATNRVSINGASDGVSALTVTGAANIQGNTIVNGFIQANTIVVDHAAMTSNSVTLTTNTQTIIDSFPKTLTQCAKYIVYVSQAPNFEVLEILLIQDANSIVIQTTYSDVYNTKIGTSDALINNANVELYFTAPSANSSNNVSIKTQRMYLF